MPRRPRGAKHRPTTATGRRFYPMPVEIDGRNHELHPAGYVHEVAEDGSRTRVTDPDALFAVAMKAREIIAAGEVKPLELPPLPHEHRRLIPSSLWQMAEAPLGA